MWGAATFPRHARLELFAGAAFGGLIIVYMALLVFTAFETEPGRFTQAVLITYFLSMPISRSAFIYLTLVKQAEKVSHDGE
jgi:hypothetical protein